MQHVRDKCSIIRLSATVQYDEKGDSHVDRDNGSE